jgi:alpha-D-ribose 1-methylphosphonate 5-triphosphate diphosphatase PhnM
MTAEPADLFSADAEEQPMDREVLDSDEMKAKAARALELAKRGKVAPGKTADDLLHMAREQRRVDSRT